MGFLVRRTDVLGAPPGTADFEIQLASGVVPLEVTRVTNGGSLAFWTAVGGSWRIGTRRLWVLRASGATNVGNLKRTAMAELPLLEAQGVHEFDVNGDWDAGTPDPPPWGRLAIAGVVEARSFDVEGAGTVFVSVRTIGATAPEVINAVVEDLLARADNASKVGPDGHLFVWVEVAAGREWMAMEPGLLPEEGPVIGSGLTLWVARQHAGGRHRPGRLWRYDGTWQSLA